MTKLTWFYCFLSDPRAVHGPVEGAEIDAMIADARLRPHDLIMPAGGEWRAVEQCQSIDTTPNRNFSASLAGSKTDSHETLDWVFMTEESGQVHGPYDVASAVAMVRQGKVSFFDWVWRTGDGHWSRVRDCARFKRDYCDEIESVRSVSETSSSFVEATGVPATVFHQEAQGHDSDEGQMTEIFLAKPRELRGVEREQRAVVSAEIRQRVADRQKPEEACGEDLLEDSYWEKGL